VPLQMGAYLNPAIAAIRRCDPELPRAARGDPDDLGTAAVAAFLAPAVIISKDSVFNPFGLALPADRWTEEAARMLVAAGYDAALEDAAHAAEVGARLLFGVIGAAKNAAGRNPKAAIATAVIAGLAAWYCHRRGWIRGEHLRAAGGRIASAARPVAERIAAADARRNQARAALTVVQGHGSASLEERCARHLARRATAMTPAELSAVLVASGTTATAEAVRAVLASHPAFTPDAQDGFILGRPARVPVISSGARPLCAAVDGSLEGRDAGRAEPVTGQISTHGSPEHVNEVAWECLRFTSAGRLTSTGSPNPRSAQ
jgi:hypothetical protein